MRVDFRQGQDHRTSKYTDQQVQEVIDSPTLEDACAAGAKHGITRAYAARIWRRKVWTHLKRTRTDIDES